MSEPKKTASKKLNIAVIGGDGTGPEVAAEGLKVLKAVAQAGKVRVRTRTISISAASATCAPAKSCRPAPSTSCARSTPSSWAPSAIPTWRRASWKRACCWNCAFSSTSTSTCGRSSSFPASRRRWRGKGPERHRLRRRPREHRRPVLRRRRLPEEGHARRSRHPDRHLHPQGLRALHPLGLRVHPQAQQPKKHAHAGRQDQRADLRPRPVVAHLPGRRPANIRTSRPTTTTSTPAACGWSRTPNTTT